jgi:hypothetical protein
MVPGNDCRALAPLSFSPVCHCESLFYLISKYDTLYRYRIKQAGLTGDSDDCNYSYSHNCNYSGMGVST